MVVYRSCNFFGVVNKHKSKTKKLKVQGTEVLSGGFSTMMGKTLLDNTYVMSIHIL